MPEPDETNTESMLQEYLDGELPEPHEEQLFSALSQRGDLRMQMREQLAIRSAIHADRTALTPPLDVTRSLFTQLGFTAPIATATISTASHVAFLSFVKRFWVPMAAVVAIGIISYQFAMKDADVPSASEPVNVTAAENDGTSRDASEHMAANNTTSTTQAASPETERAAETTSGRAIAVAAAGKASRSGAAGSERGAGSADATANFAGSIAAIVPPAVAQEQTIPPQTIDIAGIADLDARGIILPDLPPPGAPEIRAVRVRQLPYPPVYPLPMRMQIRHASWASSPSTGVASQTNPFFENTSLALLHDISDRHAVGLEVGVEAFPQRFDGMESGLRVHYEQNPVEYWMGATYQYTAGSVLFDGLHPYLQAGAGGAIEIGPYVKGAIGLRYAIVPGLSALVAAEGTLVGYRFQNAWFTTKKLGVTYGLSIQF